MDRTAVGGSSPRPDKHPSLRDREADYKRRMNSTAMDIEDCNSRWATEDDGTDGVGESTTPQRDWERRPRRNVHSPEVLSEDVGPGSRSREEIAALAQTVEDVLRHNLIVWSQSLIKLQPKVYMTRHLIECGLWLFKYLRQCQVHAARQCKYPVEQLSDHAVLLHDLIACWWIALKHCSVRTAVPNRSLMCRATGSDAATLAARERAALGSMDWRVDSALRAGGFVL